MIDLVKRLNEYDNWRSIFGKKSLRLKDEELILRFLALYYDAANYRQPMEEFLNKFAEKYTQAEQTFLNGAERLFKNTIDTVRDSLTDKAFRPERSLNAAVFDSVMVGLCRNLQGRPCEKKEAIQTPYHGLLENADYLRLISRSTADENNVKERLRKAEKAFAGL